MSDQSDLVSRLLRLRSPTELRDRGRQQLAAWFEQFSSSPSVRETSDDAFAAVLAPGCTVAALPERFRHGPAASPFFAFQAPDRAAERLRAQHPDAARAIVERAGRAVVDRFDVLGHEGLSYGRPIEWHLDPLRNRRSPRLHWRRVPYLNVERVGDHKVIWELNRHQHLVTLAQAYWITGDGIFAATVARHLGEWMDANPPKMGINWSSSLEVSLRSISWIWALHLLRTAPELPPAIVTRAMKYLFVHAEHIATHLSTYFSPNTHLTGEALGLLYLGTMMTAFKKAVAWRALGWSILERQLDLQVWPDGIYFEQTTWYQRYTADFYLHALRLRQASGDPVSEHVRARVDRLIDPLVHFTRPDGTTPLLGDDDGGQLLPLVVTSPDDFRPTLAVAGAVLGRPDCATLAREATGVLPWLVDEQEQQAFERLEPRAPSALTHLFEHGGYFVGRSGWSPGADYLLVDCGPHGSLSCGHSHADALAIVLTLGGVNVLVDAGTYSYVNPDRDTFRATSAHNTLTVDGLPSSTPAGPFKWKSFANGRVIAANATERFAFFQGSHDGYSSLPDPVAHRRTVFGVYQSFFIVRDELAARAEHVIDGRYYLAPGITPTRVPTRQDTVVLQSEAGNAGIAELSILGQNVSLDVSPAHVAPTYGITRASWMVHFATSASGNQEIVSFIVHRRRGSSVSGLQEISAERGRAFAIERDGVRELVAFDSAGVCADGIEADAGWVWMRFDVDRSRLLEFILIGGGRLAVNGKAIYESGRRHAYVAGAFDGSRWRLQEGLEL